MIYVYSAWTAVLIGLCVVNWRLDHHARETLQIAKEYEHRAQWHMQDANYWLRQAESLRNDGLRMIEQCDTTDDSEGAQDSATGSDAPAPNVSAVDSSYDMFQGSWIRNAFPDPDDVDFLPPIHWSSYTPVPPPDDRNVFTRLLKEQSLKYLESLRNDRGDLWGQPISQRETDAPNHVKYDWER